MGGGARFGSWLSATMHSRGLSQADLARDLGVADAQVSRWRRGQVVPSVRYLQRLADTFGVSRATLDSLAGYLDLPAPDPDDLEGRAEVEAHRARFARLLEDRVPRHLWPAYVDACAALADAFADAHASLDRARRVNPGAGAGPRDRDMGFPR